MNFPTKLVPYIIKRAAKVIALETSLRTWHQRRASRAMTVAHDFNRPRIVDIAVGQTAHADAWRSARRA